MKKKILIALGALTGLVVCALVVLWLLFGKVITAANSVKRLEGGLYTLDFEGNYGFEDFMEGGGASSDAEVAAYLTDFLSHGFYSAEPEVNELSPGCSTVYLMDEQDNIRFGRNYDWQDCQTMIVHTKPRNGYESISTCCLDFLGFGTDHLPDQGMMNRILSIASIYVPLDGMNEKGLMVADLMAGDDEVTHQETGKTAMTTTTAIRLLLDEAADVDEAVRLLSGIDMHSSIGKAHHLSIADARGRSVVVEYIDGEMIVTDADVVTNHYLTDGSRFGTGSEQSHQRYDTIMAMLEAGSDDPNVRPHHRVLEMLKAAAQSNYPQKEKECEITVWSIVYNPMELTADFYFRENYDFSYRLSMFDMKKWIRYKGEEGDWLDALSINEWNKPEESE